jgi:ABC-type branched-subunit amino acid transport system substrate-binding protein
MFISLVAGIAAWAAPARPACRGGEGASQGVCEDQVNIGSSVVLIGPLAKWGNDIARIGPRAYFEMVNEQGGIHGRRINYIIYNDSYRPEKALINVRKLIQKDRVLSILLQTGTMTNKASYKYVTEEKRVPLMFPATRSHFWSAPFKRYIFPLSPSYSMQAYILVAYLVITRGFRKVGIFYHEDSFGSEVKQAVIQRLKEHGLLPAGEEGFKKDQVDVTPQLMKLRERGAEAVVLAVPYNVAYWFIREAEKLGWEVQMGSVGFTGLPALLIMAGQTAAGYVNIMTVPNAGRTPGPAMEEYRLWLRRSARDASYNSSTLTGWWAAKLFTEILRRAGRDLSREKIVSAAESIRGYDSGITGPVSFYPHDHSGTTGAYIAVARSYDGGPLSFVPLGPGGPFANPLWISSWGKSVEEVRPLFESMRRFTEK